MAVDRTPVLKRCRSLNLDPIHLGVDKKSKRTLARANKKVSEFNNEFIRLQKEVGNLIKDTSDRFNKELQKRDELLNNICENSVNIHIKEAWKRYEEAKDNQETSK